MTDDILTVSELKKHFVIDHEGTVRRTPVTVKAVDGVSFELKEGETFGLVGESGSGKSTVAYITVGMYQPTSGSIVFRGEDLFANPKGRSMALKKEIQIVFQDPGSSLNPRRTIKSILDLPLRIHQPEKDRTREVLRVLNMVELIPAYVKRRRTTNSGHRQGPGHGSLTHYFGRTNVGIGRICARQSYQSSDQTSAGAKPVIPVHHP
jgi:peptide/nickel transport system ATP-binding protein